MALQKLVPYRDTNIGNMSYRLFGSTGRQVNRWLGRDGSFLRSPVAPGRQLYMYSPEPFHPIPDKSPKFTSADEAVSVIKSGWIFDGGTDERDE